MRVIDIDEAKAHLSRLIEEAAAGEEIVIAQSGKPIARLCPLAEPKPKRELGRLNGKIVVPDNFDTLYETRSGSCSRREIDARFGPVAGLVPAIHDFDLRAATGGCPGHPLQPQRRQGAKLKGAGQGGRVAWQVRGCAVLASRHRRGRLPVKARKIPSEQGILSPETSPTISG